MKVLFAVSNEEISESIVKKYQKEYKEIISYKNVYYFNAILKELQKDKTYDRVVISEDLESFTSTQYDQIDKFIFEKLDSISDEASNTRGNDIPIILICSDRRTKSEQLLVKLFGIGVYDAIIGNDRSIDEVCKLIHRPRLKKEAKSYYKIDSEEVNYQAENENDVSEMEIQNIVAHYKRLGNNEEKYIDSFNNIAAQYNDTQLRIITKFLPLNVRAVLEEKSSKYQQIMSFNNTVSDSLRYYQDKEKTTGPSETLLTQATKGQTITEPIVIPSAVNMQGGRKLSRKKPSSAPTMQESETQTQNIVQPEIKQEVEQNQQKYNNQDDFMPELSEIDKIIESKENENIQKEILPEEQPTVPVKRGRGRPRKNPIPDENNMSTVKRGRGRPRKNSIPEQTEMDENENQESNTLSSLEQNKENNLFEEILPEVDLPNVKNEQAQDGVLPGFENETINSFDSTAQEEKDKSELLPGFDDLSQSEDDNTILPGFDDLSQSEDDNTISPGFDDLSQSEDDNTILPGFDDLSQSEDDNTILPEINDLSQPEDDNTVLSGFDNSNNSQKNEILPEFNNIQETKVQNSQEENNTNNNLYQSSNNYNEYQSNNNVYIDISNLLTPDKKIATFVGTSKNGTSFIVNNIAEYMSSVMGIKTAILDTTKNRNSYYIYTKNEEQLRNIATHSIEGLTKGIAQGIDVNKNLTVYTSLPDENETINYVDEILETLIKDYSLVLIDTDFETPIRYFEQAQEIYLVQSLDILTIQPLTAFLRELKAKNILDEQKLRIILNKVVKIKGITDKTIIGGMAFYNDPAMSFMTELFNRDTIKYISIPFDQEIYTKYLQGIIECDITLKGYSKDFNEKLKSLANMVYPVKMNNNNLYTSQSGKNMGGNAFSSNMNNTLEQMRKKY